MKPKLYTADQIAERYQITRNTVYIMGRRGDLKRVKIRNMTRFYDPEDVELIERTREEGNDGFAN